MSNPDNALWRDNKAVEYASDIHQSGLHLLSLVNDVLDISAIESGKQKIIKLMIEPLPILQECLSVVEVSASTKGVTLETEFPKTLPTILADPRALKQIVLNLISNAIKFTEPGGTITLATEISDGAFHIRISDTGVGIDEEALPTITEPFTV